MGLMMADDLFYWVALSFVPGAGSVYVKRLLDRFQTPEAVFQASMKELLEVEGLGAKVASEIIKGPNEQAVKKELALVERSGARLITLKNEDYPPRLRNIYDPPALLYLRGGLKEEDELAVSIVGSRKTTPYGRWVTEKISRYLVSRCNHCERNGKRG